MVETENRFSVLEEDWGELTIDDKGESFKQTTVHVVEEMLNKVMPRSKEPWFTEEVGVIMDKRWIAKNTNQYSIIHQEIQQKCKEAKWRVDEQTNAQKWKN